jgi:hypothetical protein
MKRTTAITALLITFLVGVTAGCTVPQDKALHVLKGAGYTDINLHGHAWWDCSEDDTFATEFTAKGPTGQRVNGAVCCGFPAKNCTIRID